MERLHTQPEQFFTLFRRFSSSIRRTGLFPSL
ncbi:hypothetical protein ACVWXS_001454 [Lysinibacillus sp. TE18511]